MMDRPTFRLVYPEFASATAFPDALVDYWMGQGRIQLAPDRWGDLLDQGLGLYTAHKIAAAPANAKGAAKGQAGAVGVVSSKSIDKLSVSVDTGSVTLKDAGDWNRTTYGVQFKQLSRIVGLGGMQL